MKRKYSALTLSPVFIAFFFSSYILFSNDDSISMLFALCTLLHYFDMLAVFFLCYNERKKQIKAHLHCNSYWLNFLIRFVCCLHCNQNIIEWEAESFSEDWEKKYSFIRDYTWINFCSLHSIHRCTELVKSDIKSITVATKKDGGFVFCVELNSYANNFECA